MKKPFLFALILLLSVSLFGCINGGNEVQLNKEGQTNEKPQQTDESAKAAVASLVEDFGRKLQTVSLQAPKDIVNKSMQENYGDFVSPALLAEWLSDPQNAPGRALSSPWPDHIEILTIEKLPEYAFEVKGEIIEITSTEKVSGGVAAKRPITLVVKKIGNRWLIDAATLGAYEETNSIIYRNTQYGFSFSLPESWKGYVIVTGKWEGSAHGGPRGGETVETGPKISIRHPQWTSQNRRQDIPIMVFTLTQWNALQRAEFLVSPAPIGPSELGRNTRYVFALPARYNYAFPTGYEEVMKILESKPLQANENYIELSYSPEPVTVLEPGKPEKGWVKVKSVEVAGVAPRRKVIVHLYMERGVVESGGGEVRAFLEDRGSMYTLQDVGSYGLDLVSIEAEDTNHDGGKELVVTGGMGAAYVERKIIGYDAAKKRWVKLLAMGTPYEVDLDGDGQEDQVAVSAGVLPGYVWLYRWKEGHFEKADVARATGNIYAFLQAKEGKVWIESGKENEPHYYIYQDGKLLEIPEPPVPHPE